MMFPVGQTEPSLASGAACDVGVVLPLTTRLLGKLNLGDHEYNSLKTYQHQHCFLLHGVDRDNEFEMC